MFDNFNANSNSRPRGALEVAIRARSKERSMALLVADYQVEKAAASKKKTSLKKGWLESLLSIFLTF